MGQDIYDRVYAIEEAVAELRAEVVRLGPLMVRWAEGRGEDASELRGALIRLG